MRFFLAATFVFASSAAFADSKVTTPTSASKSDVRQMHTDDCAQARKHGRTCVIDMGKGDSIDGSAPTAGGSAIGVITTGKDTSLIHIRRDFIPEILKTAEDL
jgi:hypothetical protein